MWGGGPRLPGGWSPAASHGTFVSSVVRLWVRVQSRAVEDRRLLWTLAAIRKSRLSMTSKRLLIVVTLVALALVPSTWARSGKEYKFKGGSDGAIPRGGLVSDGAGSFYGATANGGLGYGMVYKMTLGQDGSWTETVIYKFKSGTDGGGPECNLVFDNAGNLYGTTAGGGQWSSGTVFEMSPAQGGTWTESVLYSFRGGTDGATPETGVILDSAGNLYGSTLFGGCNPTNCPGVVFELTPNQGGSWTERILYTFQGGADGEFASGLVLDSAGNLYGSTYFGGTIQGGCGSGGCGTVFELTPAQSGSWTKTVLYAFKYSLDGAYPSSGVVFDSAGSLYGEASNGGSFACPFVGCGVVYELTPESGSWKFSVAHTFNGLNGSKGWSPTGGLVFDSLGNLFGTTTEGGSSTACGNFGCGTIFKLTPSAGGHFAFGMIGSFNGTDGSGAGNGVVVDAAGKLYGTAQQGGNLKCNPPSGCGVVFTLTP